MERIFIKKIMIDKVRHLENLEIPISAEREKHLILTGKNGSGKTSLLNALAIFLYSHFLHPFDREDDISDISLCEPGIEGLTAGAISHITEESEKRNKERLLRYASLLNGRKYSGRKDALENGIRLELNREMSDARKLFQKGEFVLAYYRADRFFDAEVPQHIEKVELKDTYMISETPREDFIKYLLDLKMTQALATANGKKEKADQIQSWFEQFQNLLRRIFGDNSVRLMFDEDTFRFSITMKGREPFDFNTLSSGYAAVMDIVADLMIRMEKHSGKVFDFSMPGIVLIDEIETHLHLEMQKWILDLLTMVFPNVQFIVSTHSPFILNSLENAVIYDLESRLLVENGLSDVPYSGIVEGYFGADELSANLRNKFDRYQELAKKGKLADEDFDEIAALELYLDEIPDYLALNLTTEYQRLKQELRKREDI